MTPEWLCRSISAIPEAAPKLASIWKNRPPPFSRLSAEVESRLLMCWFARSPSSSLAQRFVYQAALQPALPRHVRLCFRGRRARPDASAGVPRSVISSAG